MTLIDDTPPRTVWWAPASTGAPANPPLLTRPPALSCVRRSEFAGRRVARRTAWITARFMCTPGISAQCAHRLPPLFPTMPSLILPRLLSRLRHRACVPRSLVFCSFPLSASPPSTLRCKYRHFMGCARGCTHHHAGPAGHSTGHGRKRQTSGGAKLTARWHSSTAGRRPLHGTALPALGAPGLPSPSPWSSPHTTPCSGRRTRRARLPSAL